MSVGADFFEADELADMRQQQEAELDAEARRRDNAPTSVRAVNGVVRSVTASTTADPSEDGTPLVGVELTGSGAVLVCKRGQNTYPTPRVGDFVLVLLMGGTPVIFDKLVGGQAPPTD